VSAPYRQDTEALRDRLAQLDAELLRLREASKTLEGLRAEEAALAREAAEVRQRLASGAAKRALPMLDELKVASPCSASWADMLGDDRVRFCLACEKNVYDLSAMRRDEAEALLASRADGELCVRYYQRADGTILTSDCPVGAKRKRRKQLALAVAGAGAMAAAAVMEFRRDVCATRQGGIAPTMGEIAVHTPAVMGSVAPIPPSPPTGPSHQAPSHEVMGKRAAVR
jgi:hypothetical protein